MSSRVFPALTAMIVIKGSVLEYILVDVQLGEMPASAKENPDAVENNIRGIALIWLWHPMALKSSLLFHV